MTFDAEETERVLRIRMARWLGVTPAEWDAMSYIDQCDAIEIARADKEIAEYDAHQANMRARAANARRNRRH